MARIHWQAGLSKLEFLVVVAVIAFTALVALERLRDVQEMGEKTAVEMTVRNIRSGLLWEMSERITTGHEASIAELAGGNPVRWLEKPPSGYLGEFPATPPNFSQGAWYFDTRHRELRYRPIQQRNLECHQCPREDGDLALSWRISPAGNPMFGRGDSVRVVAVAPYQWF